MHPKERLQEDLKNAMKSGETRRRDTLRLITSAIKQVEVDSRAALSEEQVYGVLTSEAKKRRESIAEALKAGRQDIADKEQGELEVIESYLPKQLTVRNLKPKFVRRLKKQAPKRPRIWAA